MKPSIVSKWGVSGVMVCLVLLLISYGCGGGSSDSESTPSPSPTRSPAAGLASVVARYIPATATSAARIQVLWDPSYDIPQNDIIEYHIFRDGDLIGRTNQTTYEFIDSPELDGTTFTFNDLNTGGGTTSIVASTRTIPPLTPGIPHRYRITLLYVINTGAGRQYAESTRGDSNSVSIPAP